MIYNVLMVTTAASYVSTQADSVQDAMRWAAQYSGINAEQCPPETPVYIARSNKRDNTPPLRITRADCQRLALN